MAVEHDDDIGSCICGAAWFELEPFDEVGVDADIGAAVCISPEGDITGYAGRLICIECGADWHPHQRPTFTVLLGGRDG